MVFLWCRQSVLPIDILPTLNGEVCREPVKKKHHKAFKTGGRKSGQRAPLGTIRKVTAGC